MVKPTGELLYPAMYKVNPALALVALEALSHECRKEQQLAENKAVELALHAGLFTMDDAIDYAEGECGLATTLDTLRWIESKAAIVHSSHELGHELDKADGILSPDRTKAFNKLIEKLDSANIEGSMLDSVVEAAALRGVTDINNGGLEAQIRYLQNIGMSDAQILDAAGLE